LGLPVADPAQVWLNSSLKLLRQIESIIFFLLSR
jgi:hypothetical protein